MGSLRVQAHPARRQIGDGSSVRRTLCPPGDVGASAGSMSSASGGRATSSTA